MVDAPAAVRTHVWLACPERVIAAVRTREERGRMREVGFRGGARLAYTTYPHRNQSNPTVLTLSHETTLMLSGGW